jgi:hypothetical protein
MSQPAWLTTPSFPRKLMHEMHGKEKKVAWNEEITYTHCICLINKPMVLPTLNTVIKVDLN